MTEGERLFLVLGIVVGLVLAAIVEGIYWTFFADDDEEAEEENEDLEQHKPWE